jgi:hypothetical protein
MKPHLSSPYRIWIARSLIGLVVFVNLESAVAFLSHPGSYTAAYELAGIPGDAAIRGFAILFCMWNIPYLFALWHPIKYQVSLWESILMQATGLIGESWLVSQISSSHKLLHNSILRFITFDSAGLLVLLLALGITISLWKKTIRLHKILNFVVW